MPEHPLSAQIGNRVSLTGHFDAPVVLEDVRPLGVNGSAGYECRIRLPGGGLEETVISPRALGHRTIDYAKQDEVRERVWQQRWDLFPEPRVDNGPSGIRQSQFGERRVRATEGARVDRRRGGCRVTPEAASRGLAA